MIHHGRSIDATARKEGITDENRTVTAKDASENFLIAEIPIFLMRNNLGIQLGDIIRIILAVVVVMLIYNFLLFMLGMARTIIIVILIYIVYKIIKAIL
jgi:ABC-type bacteriocin/lantibiotic exporter with double-glycine peptidase domain